MINLVLDLGGVLETLKVQSTIDALSALGHPDPKALFTRTAQSPVVTQFEIGEISIEPFCDTLAQSLRAGVTHAEIIQAWNKMLGGIEPEVVESLQAYREAGFRLFLLSNTNELHIEQVMMEFEQDHQLCFSDLFEYCFLSNEMGTRKPETEIFERVLAQLPPSELPPAFIDDLDKNVEAANNCGFRGYQQPLNSPLPSVNKILELIS